MLNALLMGLIASSAFPIGVALGLFFDLPRRVMAAVVAFGAGVLVVALTSELMAEAVEQGSTLWAMLGLVTGSIVYVVMIKRLSSRPPKAPADAAATRAMWRTMRAASRSQSIRPQYRAWPCW